MPKISRVVLTKATVDGAKPTERVYLLRDAKVPGLVLRVLPSGIRAFDVQWSRNKAISIGRYPSMTLEGARVAAARVMGEVAEHGAPRARLDEASKPTAPLTFKAFIDEHYAPWAVAHQKRGDATIAAIRAQFEFLDSKPLRDVCAFDLERFKSARLKAGIKPATVNRDLDRIRGALSRAVDFGMLEVHPIKAVKRVKGDDNTRVRYLTAAEESRLRSALALRDARRRAGRESGNAWNAARGIDARKEWKPHEYTDHITPMVLTAINTGMRRGELFGLSWEHVDLGARRVTVVAGNAKSRRARHIPLNPEVLDVLTSWRGKRRTGLVFPGEGGGRMTNINKAWDALTAAAKLDDFRFHDCRHHFASRLVQAGVDLYTVKELLGHSDFAMTQRYAHLAPDHLAAAVALVAIPR